MLNPFKKLPKEAVLRSLGEESGESSDQEGESETRVGRGVGGVDRRLRLRLGGRGCSARSGRGRIRRRSLSVRRSHNARFIVAEASLAHN